MEIINNGWILNDVAVPAKRDKYLVCCKGGYVAVIEYCGGWNCRIDYESGEVIREHEFNDVVAWMPRPELPEGLKND